MPMSQPLPGSVDEHELRPQLERLAACGQTSPDCGSSFNERATTAAGPYPLRDRDGSRPLDAAVGERPRERLWACAQFVPGVEQAASSGGVWS